MLILALGLLIIAFLYNHYITWPRYLRWYDSLSDEEKSAEDEYQRYVHYACSDDDF